MYSRYETILKISANFCGKVMFACVSAGIGAIAGVVLVRTYTDWRRVCEVSKMYHLVFNSLQGPLKGTSFDMC